jgi:hypothetical protein
MIFMFRESSLIGSEFLGDGEGKREAQALQGKAIMRPETGRCKEVFDFPQDRDRWVSFGV